MLLNLFIDEKQIQHEVPDIVLQDGHEFFKMIDADMDKGWQMGTEYIESPNPDQRIQIVADRLLGALESNKRELADLLTGYIVTKDPRVQAIRINTTGEPLETEILR